MCRVRERVLEISTNYKEARGCAVVLEHRFNELLVTFLVST